MTTVAHIQALPNWQVITGSDIGPAVPKITFTQEIAPPPPPPPATLTMDITGVVGKYADGVVRSPDLPLPPGTSSAILTAVFSVDEASLEFAGGLEMGGKFTDSEGYTNNGQIQFSYNHSQTEMLLDLTSILGEGWDSTGNMMPKFAPDVLHTVATAYEFQPKFGVSYVEVDGRRYVTAEAMEGVAYRNLGWPKDTFMVNMQPNTNQKGGNWLWTLHDVNVELA